MEPNITYRLAIHYVWEDGHNPDPEIYWVEIDEAISLIDSVLTADAKRRTKFHVGLVTCSPHRETNIRLRGHYDPPWHQLAMFGDEAPSSS